MLDLILGRSDNIVKVGDVVLGISFAVKDAMLDWEWLGIHPVEWPPQRLDWEMYRIEHLSFVSNMEAQFAGWLGRRDTKMILRSSCGPSEDKIHKRMFVFHFDDQTS